MRPYDCKKLDEVCSLRRDNYENGKFWIITDGFRVTIAEQIIGEEPSQEITIDRATFNRLISWYMKEQKAAKAA